MRISLPPVHNKVKPNLFYGLGVFVIASLDCNASEFAVQKIHFIRKQRNYE